MEFFRQKSKGLGVGWRSRFGRSCGYLGLVLGLIGCGTVKKAGIVATAAGTGAVAGTVFSGGAIAPIVGATTSAFVADVATGVTDTSQTTMDSCAPDNFWTLLGSLVEMGGWLLILVVVIPMVLGWFLPGPVKMKGREPKHPNPLMR